jgi:hypothetical protein
MAGLVSVMYIQARSGLKRMSRARSGPTYHAWPATSFDAATAQLDMLVTLVFWGGRGPVISAAERIHSARPSAQNPSRRATFQQVVQDAPRSAVAHLAASVHSDPIMSVSIKVMNRLQIPLTY